jgi:hypothetical protein
MAYRNYEIMHKKTAKKAICVPLSQIIEQIAEPENNSICLIDSHSFGKCKHL